MKSSSSGSYSPINVTRSAALISAASTRLLKEMSRGRIQPLDASAKSRLLLRRQIGYRHLDLDFRRRAWLRALGSLRIGDRKITALIEVMLIHGWPSAKPVWPQGEIYRFEYRRFAGVVVADQNGVIGQHQFSRLDAPKVFDRYRVYLHYLPPTPARLACAAMSSHRTVGTPNGSASSKSDPSRPCVLRLLTPTRRSSAESWRMTSAIGHLSHALSQPSRKLRRGGDQFAENDGRHLPLQYR